MTTAQTKLLPILAFIALPILLSACKPAPPSDEVHLTIPTTSQATLVIPTTAPPTFSAETPVPTQTASTSPPPATDVPPAPGLPPLDQSDLASVMAWMNALLKAREAGDIDQVVGSQGSLFAPYAVGVFPPGYDNGPEIAAELEKAFAGAQPVCLGYDPNFGTAPDKAALFVKGLNFDWPSLGLPGDVTDITTLQFFNLEGLWQLIFIVPMPDWGLPDLSTLQDCP